MLTKINFRFILALAFINVILFSCSEESTEPKGEIIAKFAVISDVHLYDGELGTSGAAFEDYLLNDRKMLAESEAIMESVITSLLASDASIILVPGDLTKDGEKTCHQKLAGYFKQLEDAGKKVYVVPGNHDIGNVNSLRYDGPNTSRVDNITVSEFKTIYNEFGFKEAITGDPNSLSYIVEPVDGLWLFCMDACLYKNIVDKNIDSARFSDETLDWLKSKLQEAKSKGKLVFGMMHHGLLEHFTGQKTNPISSEYVVDDWSKISTDFADLGMKIVFTGHFHANDIVQKVTTKSFIFDVETGSPLSFPCPYRFVNLTADKKVKITTSYVTAINYDLNGKTFSEYAQDFFMTKMTIYTFNELVNNYGLDTETANQFSLIIAGAYAAHCAGDEYMPAEAQTLIQQLKSSSGPRYIYFGYTLEGWFTDLPPKDGNITIDLNTGIVTE